MDQIQLCGERVVFVEKDFEIKAMFFNRGSTVLWQLRRYCEQARVAAGVFFQIVVKS